MDAGGRRGGGRLHDLSWEPLIFTDGPENAQEDGFGDRITLCKCSRFVRVLHVLRGRCAGHWSGEGRTLHASLSRTLRPSAKTLNDPWPSATLAAVRTPGSVIVCSQQRALHIRRTFSDRAALHYLT